MSWFATYNTSERWRMVHGYASLVSAEKPYVTWRFRCAAIFANGAVKFARGLRNAGPIARVKKAFIYRPFAHTRRICECARGWQVLRAFPYARAAA